MFKARRAEVVFEPTPEELDYLRTRTDAHKQKEAREEEEERERRAAMERTEGIKAQLDALKSTAKGKRPYRP